MKRPKFPNAIVVRKDGDPPNDNLIVGQPDRPHEIDADDGTVVAIYSIKVVKTYRQHKRLE